MNALPSSTARPRRRLFGWLLVIASLGFAAACGPEREAGDQADPTSTAHSDEIAWFDGSIEEAFALAKAEGKPMFLYWGAEWCPPCHYLKNRVFKQPEFVARMREFVPVYLDGDTARAQILGEELEVKGYPTVIVFDPLGREVMRMPSTVPTDQYDEVLQAAIGSMRPVSEVLEQVLATGPAAATDDDLHLLAFYSWGQDSRVGLDLTERLDAFRRLYTEAPRTAAIEHSRFLGLYLQSLAEAARSEESPLALDDNERDRLRDDVLQVLRQPNLRNSNLLWIDYYADSIIDLLAPESSTERQELVSAWQAAADAMELDETLSVDDRLTATLLKIELATLDAAEEVEIPGELQAHARRQAAWAIETVTDESELQTVVNTLAYLLEAAGLSQEAEAMLLAKMNDTVAPYYFMSWIAGIKEDGGDTDAALSWHRKAYEASRGRYSRFRWGSTYLRRLMSLDPDSSERIEADSIAVLSELLTHDDAFAGGNYARLGGLEDAYRDWNEDGDHSAEISRIREFVRAACSDYPAGGPESQRSRCEAFLVPESPPEAV